MKKNTVPSAYSCKRSSSGLGLFANFDIKKGAFIIEYTGEHISHEKADRRGGKYLFILDDRTVIDGKGRENIARYINHSCKPNAEAEVDEDGQKIRILAKRTIQNGEEITYDYGKDYWKTFMGPDLCMCVACREKRA